jgi:hypothetical protein
MSYIEDNICEAIELIVDKSVKEAGFDRTIQATIKKCSDESTGYYQVKYQDSSFYAYAADPSISYSEGTAVYVLIPQNDMSKVKTILGSVDKIGDDYLDTSEKDSNFEVIGANGISQTSLYNLSSYKTELKEIYNADSESNDLEVNTEALLEYMKEASSLICGATFKTSLAAEQQLKGNYGISFVVEYNSEVAEGETYTKTYTVDIDNMTGNPYKLISGKRQYGIYAVSGASFKRIKSISLFVENFPYQKTDEEISAQNLYDIKISNIEFNAAAELKQDESTGCSLSLLTPQGTLFTQSSKDDDTLTINAQVKVKGRVVNATAQDLVFYWFIEDLSITNKHHLYNKYGGKGWRCLNSYNIVDEDTGLISWLNDCGNSYKVTSSLASMSANRFKCVVIYKEVAYSKIITIKNLKATTHQVTVESNNGTKFCYGSGNFILTCKVDGSINTNYNYVWTQEDSYGNIEILDTTTAELPVINAEEIVTFSKFNCMVYEGETAIGSASITIQNVLESESVYSLALSNHIQVYVYDEDGVSPCSITLDNPQATTPISFVVYDNLGKDITNDVLKNGEVIWTVPLTNTLLTDVLPKESSATTETDETQGVEYIHQSAEITYGIRDRYYYNYSNNTINLAISYQGVELTAKTYLTFVKQGASGTNGTSYVCKIVPNTTLTDGSVPNYVEVNMVGQDSEGNYVTGYFNYGNDQLKIGTDISASDTRAPFIVKLYRGGEELFSGTTSNGSDTTVKWEMLSNQYKKKVSDLSDFTIDSSTGKMAFTGTAHGTTYNSGDLQCGANIVKCTVKYTGDNEKQILTANMPIIVSYVTNSKYRIYLKDNTGFTSVQYTSDGVQPKYDTSSPFEVEVYDNGVQIDVDSINYTWGKGGTVYSYEDDSSGNAIFADSQDLIHLSAAAYTKKLKSNQRNFRPLSSYFGVCKNNTVICYCGDYGHIYIPIYFYLNKYGFSQLNDWDGNSIELNEDGGYILAPQMGAGSKNDKNQFTGVLMGEVQESNRKSSEQGIFGYKDGQRSFTLSAEDGHAVFGAGTISSDSSESTGGAIVIDPSTEDALLYSNSYWKAYGENGLPENYTESNMTDKGMLIDLSKAWIRSPNFKVNGEEGSFLVGINDGDVENGTNEYLSFDYKRDTKGNILYQKDSDGNYLLDDSGNKIPEGKELIISASKISFGEDRTKHNLFEEVNNISSKADNASTTATAAQEAVKKTVKSIVIEYTLQDVSEGITNDDSAIEWSVTPPTWIDGKFIWTRQKYVYQDETFSEWTTPVCITGNTGATGNGVQTQITRYAITETYTKPASGSSLWSTTLPTTITPGYYIWTEITTTFTDALPAVAYSVTRAGLDGINGTTQYIHYAYADSSDGSSNFSYDDPTGRTYMGVYVDNQPYDKNTKYSDYTWSLIKSTVTATKKDGKTVISIDGQDQAIVDDGVNGTSVTLVSKKVEYQYSSDGQNSPTSGWSETLPAVQKGKYLWTKTSVTYKEGDKTLDPLESYSVSYIAEDGITPTVTATKSDGKTVISINGEKVEINDGTNGTSMYCYIRYSNDKTSFTDDYSTAKYVGFYTGTIASQSAVSADKYSWKEVKGKDGTTVSVIKDESTGTVTITTTDSSGSVVSKQTVKDGANGDDGKNAYFHVKYSNDGGKSFTGNSGEDTGSWIGTYTDNIESDSTSVSQYNWVKIQGENGTNGAGVDTVTEYYAVGTSSSTAPASGEWKTSPSQCTLTSANRYLWNYEVVTYTEGKTQTESQKRVIGMYSEDGKAGKGVKSITNYYQASAVTDSSKLDSSKWSTAFTDTSADAPYLWNYEKVEYTEGAATSSTPQIISKYTPSYTWIKYADDASGTNMSDEPTGKKYIGIATNQKTAIESSVASDYKWSLVQGEKGATGNGISTISYTYLCSSSTDEPDKNSSGWGTLENAITNYNEENQYLWQKEIISYTQSSSQITINLIGVYGRDGVSPKVEKTEIFYQQTTTGTSHPEESSSSWSTTPPTTKAGTYTWTKCVQTFSDGQQSVSYNVSYNGTNGTNGTSPYIIDSKTTYQYAQSSSASTPPTSGWSSTVPTVTLGYYLWTKTILVYSDNKTATIYGLGKIGTNGTNGVSATSVQLSNENHTFQAMSDGKAVANSITINVYGYIGSTKAACTVGSIDLPTGMSWSSSNNGTTSAAIELTVSTSMTTKNGTLTIPVTCNGLTFNKIFTYNLSIPGTAGSNASLVEATPTTQFFKCASDSTTYTPESITITPVFTNCSYSSWQYSTDGGSSWNSVTSGSNGLTISGNNLIVANTSSLYTTSITSIAFKVNASGNKSDVVTISRLKDGDTGKAGTTMTAVHYQVSSSNTSVPTGTWTTSIPKTSEENKYLWTRTSYSDGTHAYSVSSTMDSVKIGGRNLLRGTKTWDEDKKDFTTMAGELDNSMLYNDCLSIKTTKAWQGKHFAIEDIVKRNGIKVGDILTYSCMCRTNFSPTKDMIFRLYRISNDKSVVPFTTVQKDSITANNWFQVSVSFVVTDKIVNNTLTTVRFETDYNIGDSACTFGTDKYLYFCAPKLEFGNFATNWTPAPEDNPSSEELQKAYEKAKGYVEEYTKGQLENYTEKTLANYASKDVLDEAISAVKSTLVTDYKLEGLAKQVSDFSEELSAATNGLTELNTYKNHVAITDSDGIYISAVSKDVPSVEGAYKLHLTNEKIEFLDNNNATAWLSGQFLYINKAVLKEGLYLGENFIFTPNKTTGNLSLVKRELSE